MYKLKSLISIIVKWALVVMLLAMTIVIFVQIIFRYFFEIPFVWSEELALVLMIWVTFLGSALLLESKEHISIDFMIELMPPTIQKGTAIITAFLMLIFNVALTYGAFLVVQITAASYSPGMGISMGWHYGGTMLGGLLMIIVSLEQLTKSLGYSVPKSLKS